jgi:hypothetical protein
MILKNERDNKKIDIRIEEEFQNINLIKDMFIS